MGWLITLAILVLLAILPVGVRAAYTESGVSADIRVGPFGIRLLPAKKKKKEKPAKEKKAKKPPKEKKKKEKAPEEKKGGSWKDFLPLVRVALDFLGDLRRKLRVDILEMKLTLAGGDPAGLAIRYGRAWAALGGIMPQLERAFVIRKRDLNVACDFTESKTTIYARIQITLTVGRAISLLVRYGIRGLKEFLKMKKAKAVRTNE